MGSEETATATTGGPRVIDVFDGNGAPSGPNMEVRVIWRVITVMVITGNYW